MAHAKQTKKANTVQSIIISSRPNDSKNSTLSLLNNIFLRSHRDAILSPPEDEDYN